jgi:predicted permease
VLILLIAAVNLGTLMFVRLESARHELAIRFALGARRRFVVYELALQGFLLGIAGALGAVLVATYTSQAIAAFLLKDYLVPTSLAVAPDARVIALTIVACIGLTAMVSALAAWAVTAPQLVSLASAGVRTVARSARIGRILVSAQAALAIVLLTGASLLQRNILRINAAESGLTSDSVLVGTPLATFNAYRALDRPSYYREALANVEALPGVSSAAFSQHRPQRGAVTLERVGLAASPRGDGETAAETALISPRFFDTLGIAILQGRDFTFNDGERSARVAIVSHHLATRLFGQGRGVGERIRVSNRPELQDLRVIGIVNDARVFDIRTGNLDIVYMPALQSGRAANFRFLIARAPATSMRGIQQAIESLGVETMRGMQTMDYWRGRTLLQERVMAALGSYFGLLALVLVAAGVYGLLMYALSLRRKELGIRMALGAGSFRIARAVLAEGTGAAGVGLAIGLVAAVPSVRLLQRVLVAVTPHDPVAIAGACVVLLAIAGLASLAPAIRAARVEPLAELRRD